MRQQQILKAARKLFFEKHYEQVSIADLEKESGLTRGPLYYYFRNKEEIYAGVVVDGLRLLNNEIANLPREPRAFIKGIVQHFSQLYTDDEALFDIQFRFFFRRSQAISLPAEYQDEITETVNRNVHLVTSVIREGCGTGVFKCANPEFATLSIWGLLVTTLQMDKENIRFRNFGLDRAELQASLEAQILTMLGCHE